MRASCICFAWLCVFAFNQDPRFLFLSSVFFLYLFWGFNLATKTLVSFLFSKLLICQHELRLCSGPGLGTDSLWHSRLVDWEEGPRLLRQDLKAKYGGPCDLQSQSLRRSRDVTDWEDQPDLEGRQSCWRRKRMCAEPQARRTPKRQKHQEQSPPVTVYPQALLGRHSCLFTVSWKFYKQKDVVWSTACLSHHLGPHTVQNNHV